MAFSNKKSSNEKDKKGNNEDDKKASPSTDSSESKGSKNSNGSKPSKMSFYQSRHHAAILKERNSARDYGKKSMAGIKARSDSGSNRKRSQSHNSGVKNSSSTSASGPSSSTASAAYKEGKSDSDGENDDLRILLDRLQNHYYTHHYHPSPDDDRQMAAPPVDKQRAFYLLEASAGNIELATALYWDDFVASSSQQEQQHHQHDFSYQPLYPRYFSAREFPNDGESSPRTQNNRERSRSSSNVSKTAAIPSSSSATRKRSREEGKGEVHEQNNDEPEGRSNYASSRRAVPNLRRSRDDSSTSSTNALAPYDDFSFRSVSRQRSNSRGRSALSRSRVLDHIDQIMNQINRPRQRHNFSGRNRESIQDQEEEQEAQNNEAAQPEEEQVADNDDVDVDEDEDQPHDNDDDDEHPAVAAVEGDHHNNSVSISDDEAAAAFAERGLMVGVDNDDDGSNGRNDNSSLARKKRKLQVMRKIKLLTRKRRRKAARESGNSSSSSSTSGASANHLKKSSRSRKHERDDNKDISMSFKFSPSSDDDSKEDSEGFDISGDEFSDEEGPDIYTSNPSTLLWGTPTVSIDDSLDLENPDSMPIPLSWKNASFSLSSSYTGLQCPVQDISETGQKIQSSTDGGVTGILSLVMALIQSGACVQGSKITVNTTRKRFSDLTKEERHRSFSARLADALTCLLHIAATSAAKHRAIAVAKRQKRIGLLPPTSSKRKRKGKNKSSSTNLSKYEIQMIELEAKRELKLCPVCSWEDESPDNSQPKVGEAISTSSTNIQDLKCYVLSNLFTFMAPGGCALFLETLIRIHGEKRLERMISEVDGNIPLIKCRGPPKLIPKGKNKADWLEWLDCESFSVELVSLLLTGKIHTSYKSDWDTCGLGIGIIGILSYNEKGEVSPMVEKKMMEPVKPVWLVKGENCFSCMWLSDLAEIEYTKQSGSTFMLVHWNCWSAGRKTTLKIITSGRPSTLKEGEDSDKGESDPDAGPIITQKEINKICHDPEDEQFYPDKFERWTYHFQNLDDEKNTGVKNFKPYYRLDPREKLLVDFKYAPKINRVIWSRWENARVDQCNAATSPVV